jgi:predicted lactoylglutathione lyase
MRSWLGDAGLVDHVSLSVADSPDEVDAFHAAALAHGGRSLDAPRVRPEFGGLYSASMLDPEGNVIEVANDPSDAGWTGS